MSVIDLVCTVFSREMFVCDRLSLHGVCSLVRVRFQVRAVLDLRVFFEGTAESPTISLGNFSENLLYSSPSLLERSRGLFSREKCVCQGMSWVG